MGFIMNTAKFKNTQRIITQMVGNGQLEKDEPNNQSLPAGIVSFWCCQCALADPGA